MNIRLIAIAALMMVAPGAAYAATTLQADDSVAGLGTDIDIVDAEANTELLLVVTPPLGSETEQVVRTDSVGNATVQLTGRNTEVAGMYRVSLERNGAKIGVSTTFEILPDSISSATSSIQLSSNTVMPTGMDTVEAVIILRDQYGNPLPSRPLKLISSRSGDRISSLQSETDESGKQSFTLSTKENGTLYLRAIDLLSGTLIDAEAVVFAGASENGIGGPQSTTANGRQLYGGQYGSNLAGNVLGRNLRGQVTGFGLVDHFEIIAPTELAVNEDATISITAVDRNGNRVEDYTNLVYLSSTDPLAFLPVGGEVQFEARNLGEKVLTLGLRFRTADDHILYAEDSTNPNIYGQAFIKVTGDGPATGTKKIQITSPQAATIFNTPNITVTGITEPFVNLIVTGGAEDVEGDTDINGGFSITVPLDPEKEEHSLRVQDKDGIGRLDSGEIVLYLDNKAPVIAEASFSPENPVEETNVLLVVNTEQQDIAQITVQLAGESTQLDRVPEKPGVYHYLFTAPAAGTYDSLISVTDGAGNTTEQTLVLQVAMKGLPKVQNLQAISETNAVTLQWDPIVSEKVDAYRIYVGESATEFDFNLDTDFATSAAQVAGLRPGTTYFFAVTALEAERESETYDVVSAMVKGLRLIVAPQDFSLFIDWTSLVTDTPLSSFILEFGVEPDTYTEKRILNSELRTYALRDLINGVKYYLKLIPVDVTGQLMEDFAATAEGTPGGDGFVITPGDEVPFNTSLIARTPPPDLHRSAPLTASTGLPTAAWWALILSAAMGLMLYWQRRRKLHTTVAFLQAMNSRYKQK